jgi:hypothetical protein
MVIIQRETDTFNLRDSCVQKWPCMAPSLNNCRPIELSALITSNFLFSGPVLDNEFSSAENQIKCQYWWLFFLQSIVCVCDNKNVWIRSRQIYKDVFNWNVFSFIHSRELFFAYFSIKNFPYCINSIEYIFACIEF